MNYSIVFVESVRETDKKAVTAVQGSVRWRWAQAVGALGETCHRIPGGGCRQSKASRRTVSRREHEGAV